jgi:hypothetical protein
MAEFVPGTRLQLDEDELFQRRDWICQRIAWVAFALVLLAALLGLFGSGPLSTATVSGDGFEVEYERFARRGRAMWLVVRIEEPPAGAVVIEISQEYLEVCTVERTEPTSTEEASGELMRRFEFDAEPGSAAEYAFRLEPGSAGLVRGTIAVNGGDHVEFSTFLYP